ncbi:2'-5' RNA ligase family protein [Niabella drilacis]|uniref:2'-5' RNA ligase n=1 Tax=Niabella drilacis (strain DSM 25811 / CCM 8410 / CCUG 62505 / LMG 26954 / E90) TaxID=1285928 RepID=A0A1G6NR23_NIADE|nr:hypothetical protein [Niabella drilacis]SDC69615.1 2'-5' RNA ligase [Niabella drilacis]
MQDIITYTRDVRNRYQLILDIPDAARRKVIDARTGLDAFFRGTPVPGGRPFIYLAEFSAFETEEQAVIEPLSRIALGAMPFKIHLKGYGQLNRAEIYIRIAETGWITALISRIAGAKVPWSDERFNPLPRISLARNLQPWQFEQGWALYGHEPFQSRFILNGMLLLKQSPGYRSWQIVRRFLFENQLIAD